MRWSLFQYNHLALSHNTAFTRQPQRARLSLVHVFCGGRGGGLRLSVYIVYSHDIDTPALLVHEHASCATRRSSCSSSISITISIYNRFEHRAEECTHKCELTLWLPQIYTHTHTKSSHRRKCMCEYAGVAGWTHFFDVLPSQQPHRTYMHM